MKANLTVNTFHSVAQKSLGSRVKIYKHPASRASGFYYGTVREGKMGHRIVVWDDDVLPPWPLRDEGFNLILA